MATADHQSGDGGDGLGWMQGGIDVSGPVFPCANCGANTLGSKCCSRCKEAYYCSVKCQKRHWKRGHSTVCTAPVVTAHAQHRHSTGTAQSQHSHTAVCTAPVVTPADPDPDTKNTGRATIACPARCGDTELLVAPIAPDPPEIHCPETSPRQTPRATKLPSAPPPASTAEPELVAVAAARASAEPGPALSSGAAGASGAACGGAGSQADAAVLELEPGLEHCKHGCPLCELREDDVGDPGQCHGCGQLICGECEGKLHLAPSVGCPRCGVRLNAAEAVRFKGIQAVASRKPEGRHTRPAQTRLGLMLVRGEGTVADARAGAEMLSVAAGAGCPKAMFNLGVLHWNGIGVAESIEEAARLFETSADLGYVEAQVQAGKLFEEGHGVGHDGDKAMALYKRAAAQQHPEAQLRIGMMMAGKSGGEWCSQNLDEAAVWMRRAADQGLPDAQFELAELLLEGLGVNRDAPAALKLLQRAAVQGNHQSSCRLGEMHLTGGHGVSFDVNKAVGYLQRPAEAEVAEATALLNQLYPYGTTVTIDGLAGAAAAAMNGLSATVVEPEPDIKMKPGRAAILPSYPDGKESRIYAIRFARLQLHDEAAADEEAESDGGDGETERRGDGDAADDTDTDTDIEEAEAGNLPANSHAKAEARRVQAESNTSHLDDMEQTLLDSLPVEQAKQMRKELDAIKGKMKAGLPRSAPAAE